MGFKEAEQETGFSQTQFQFLLPELECIFYILVPVRPELEFQFLVPVLAKPEPEIGFQQIFSWN